MLRRIVVSHEEWWDGTRRPNSFFVAPIEVKLAPKKLAPSPRDRGCPPLEIIYGVSRPLAGDSVSVSMGLRKILVEGSHVVIMSRYHWSP